jgi:hypothetical protein
MRALHERGYVLRCVDFSAAAVTARVVVQYPSHRVVELERRCDDVTRDPTDLPGLLVEAVCRLGAAGWAAELADVVRRSGLVVSAPPVGVAAFRIRDLAVQPDRLVRVAYWWARSLIARGWRLEQLGVPVAGGGFIAHIPGAEGAGPVLAIYPRGMREDGTAASALANLLYRLGSHRLQVLAHLVDAAQAGGSRVWS